MLGRIYASFVCTQGPPAFICYIYKYLESRLCKQDLYKNTGHCHSLTIIHTTHTPPPIYTYISYSWKLVCPRKPGSRLLIYTTFACVYSYTNPKFTHSQCSTTVTDCPICPLIPQQQFTAMCKCYQHITGKNETILARTSHHTKVFSVFPPAFCFGKCQDMDISGVLHV